MPLIMFVCIVVLVANKASQSPIVTLPDATDDYVQRLGLCENLSHVSENSTNTTAYTIYHTCRHLEELERIYYSRRLNVVQRFQHSFLIPGNRICSNDTQVVLLVHSYHDFIERRQAIRQTWGGAVTSKRWPNVNMTVNVRIAFVFGVHANMSGNWKLLREQDQYGDIVQGDFIDSYKNMTLKSLLGLKWVTEHCPMVKHVIKTDDDMIINFPYLLSVLRETDMTWSIMGPLNLGAKVYRSRSKWSLTKSEFPFFYFPPYESGSAYIISMDLVRPLLECSDYVPYIFVDDVYITGILGKILKVRHKRQKGFAYWTNKEPHACDVINNKIITGTRVKPALQYSLWKDIETNIYCHKSLSQH